MEDTTKQETKKSCYCTAVFGALVIALAWWQPSWEAIALTVLGVILILRDLKSSCPCTSWFCKPKA